MAQWMKNRQMNLRGKRYQSEIEENSQRMPGDPVRIIETGIDIDRTVFQKSKAEKEILKLAKIQHKIDMMKK